MGQFGRPMTAEAGADDSNASCIDLRSFSQVFQRRGVNLVGVRSGKHGAFARSRTIHHEAAPALFYKRFGKGVAFLLPIVDAAPMHNQWSGHFLRQPQMTDDWFALKWNGYTLYRDLEILRCSQKHLPGFYIAVVFTGSAGKGVARNAVVAVGL
jgi:hypothetical protein